MLVLADPTWADLHGNKIPKATKKKSSFSGFDSSGKSINPLIISAVGIAAVPAELKSTSSLRDRKRQGAASEPWVLPSGASQFSIPGNYSALLWDVESKRTLPAVSRDDVHPSVCSHRCIPQEWALAEHPGAAAAASRCSPRPSHPHPSAPCRGTCGGHRAPLFPLTKGRLWLCTVPQPGCSSRAPARKGLRMPSSPRQPHQVTRVSPALPGPPRPSLPLRGSQAGRLQPAVYLRNYVWACERGFCQRCRTWFSVSSM